MSTFFILVGIWCVMGLIAEWYSDYRDKLRVWATYIFICPFVIYSFYLFCNVRGW